MCYRCAKNKKVMAAAFNFFYSFENRGIPENFWEFPRFFGNSRDFFGIPINFREFPRGFGKNKKKNVVPPKSGKKKLRRCNGNT